VLEQRQQQEPRGDAVQRERFRRLDGRPDVWCDCKRLLSKDRTIVKALTGASSTPSIQHVRRCQRRLCNLLLADTIATRRSVR